MVEVQPTWSMKHLRRLYRPPSKTTRIAEEEKDKVAKASSAVNIALDNTVITPVITPISSMKVN